MGDREIPWKWLVALLLWFTAIFLGIMAMGLTSDARDRERHLNRCVAVAESIEGFRRCADAQ